MYSLLRLVFVLAFQDTRYMHGRRSLRGTIVPGIDNIRWLPPRVGLEEEMEDGVPAEQVPIEQAELNRGGRNDRNQHEQHVRENEGSVHGYEHLGLTMGEYTLPFFGNAPTAIVLDDISRQYELKTMHISLRLHSVGDPLRIAFSL